MIGIMSLLIGTILGAVVMIIITVHNTIEGLSYHE